MDGEIQLGPGQWTDYAKDTLFAPELSKLSRSGASPIAEPVLGDRDRWLGKYILNTTFRYPQLDPIRQIGFAFLRRADAAVSEHEAGRRELELYFTEGKPTRLTRYSRSLSHFETCIANTCQAWDLARRLAPGQPKLFEQGDGSDLQRLRELYNASKHLDERLQIGEHAPESTLHIWLTDTGLKSTKTSVTFDELRQLLESLYRIANAFANPP